jgi:hypothetical protein
MKLSLLHPISAETAQLDNAPFGVLPIGISWHRPEQRDRDYDAHLTHLLTAINAASIVGSLRWAPSQNSNLLGKLSQGQRRTLPLHRFGKGIWFPSKASGEIVE